MSILIYYKEMEVPTMEDNVQLREEEIVGDEVVLSDIYPKTNTSSIVIDTTALSLPSFKTLRTRTSVIVIVRTSL